VCAWSFAGTKVAKVTHDLVQDLVRELEAEGLAKATVNAGNRIFR
jgi:hypothetical protein